MKTFQSHRAFLTLFIKETSTGLVVIFIILAFYWCLNDVKRQRNPPLWGNLSALPALVHFRHYRSVRQVPEDLCSLAASHNSSYAFAYGLLPTARWHLQLRYERTWKETPWSVTPANTPVSPSEINTLACFSSGLGFPLYLNLRAFCYWLQVLILLFCMTRKQSCAF